METPIRGKGSVRQIFGLMKDEPFSAEFTVAELAEKTGHTKGDTSSRMSMVYKRLEPKGILVRRPLGKARGFSYMLTHEGYELTEDELYKTYHKQYDISPPIEEPAAEPPAAEEPVMEFFQCDHCKYWYPQDEKHECPSGWDDLLFEVERAVKAVTPEIVPAKTSLTVEVKGTVKILFGWKE